MLSSIVRLQDNQFIMRQAGRREGAQSIFTIISNPLTSPHLTSHLFHVNIKLSDSCRLSWGPGGGFRAKPAGSGAGGAWRRWSQSTRGSEPWDYRAWVSAIHQTSSTALDSPEHHREDNPEDRLDTADTKPGTFSKAIIDPPIWEENLSRVPAPEKGSIIYHYCRQ